MKIRNLIKNRKLEGALILLVSATMITGGLNYLYQMAMGRMLGRSIYGEFGALYAFAFFIFSIFSRTLKVGTANFVSGFCGKGDRNSLAIFHKKLFWRMFIVGLGILVLFILLSPLVSGLLHIDSPLLIMMVGLMLFFSFLLPVNLGTLQGLQNFLQLTLANISQATSKLILGILLVIMGFGIFGAMGGVVLGWLLALLLSTYFIRKKDLGMTGEHRKLVRPKTNMVKSGPDLWPMLRFSGPVFLSIVCLAVPTNIDILVVKFFYSSAQTGLYTAAAVFGKIIYFLPIGISTVMFPKIVKLHSRKQDSLHILHKSMGYTAILAGGLTLLYCLFPELLLIFYGEHFSGATSLLPLYGALMFFSSLSVLLVYFNLARKQFGAIYIFSFLTLASVVMMTLFHHSMVQILKTFLIMNFIMFISLCFITFRYHVLSRQQNRKIDSNP